MRTKSYVVRFVVLAVGLLALVTPVRMLADTHPDFVIALGRHSVMAETAHYLLDHGYPFLMEKPMGISAGEVRGIADKADARKAFVAVSLAQRYQPFVARARQLLAEGRLGPLSHFVALKDGVLRLVTPAARRRHPASPRSRSRCSRCATRSCTGGAESRRRSASRTARASPC